MCQALSRNRPPRPLLLSVATPSSLASFLACGLKTESRDSVLLSSPGLCLSLSVPPRFPPQNLHQLKQIQTLKQMNEQLQAENRALARVVARLSRSAEASETQEL